MNLLTCMVLHGLEIVFKWFIFNLPRISELGIIPTWGYWNRDRFLKSINLKSRDRIHYIFMNWPFGDFRVIFVWIYIYVYTCVKYWESYNMCICIFVYVCVYIRVYIYTVPPLVVLVSYDWLKYLCFRCYLKFLLGFELDKIYRHFSISFSWLRESICLMLPSTYHWLYISHQVR